MSKLNAARVKSLKEPGKYVDGKGLMLVIGGDGSRKWVLRCQVSGRRRDIGLGAAADVSLADARDAADDMRKALRNGADPVAERRRKVETIPTFKEAAKAAHAERKAGWRNGKHTAQWLSTLETYVFPELGALPVDQIDGPMIRDVLAPIWLTKPETARRVRQRIAAALDFAHAKGWRDAEAPMRAVSRGLPKQPRKDKHFAAMPWQDVPAFVAGMADTLKAGETVRLALEFTILTAARSGEVRGMRWQEVDGKIWTVPAERMKANRTHRFPLSTRALKILHRMAELRRTDDPGAFVFEGAKKGRPLSDMSLTMPLRRAAVGVTVHGFRSAFRDWCAEATEYPREIAEAQLAHVLSNKVEAAYARTDHFEKRRAMMAAWCKFAAGKAQRDK